MSIWSRIERRLSDLANELLPDEFREQVIGARELLEEGHAREAAETLEAMIVERPDHAGALSLLGVARIGLGDPRGARDAFVRALQARPDLPEALAGKGEACLALGEWDEAAAAFRDALREARGDRAVLAASYRGLGLAYRRLGDRDKAVRELRKAVAEDPADALARAALGEALLGDEDVSTEEAREHLARAIEGEAPPPLARLALGRLALDDGLADEGSEHFRAVLEAAAEGDRERRADALVGLGDAALLSGDEEAATGHYREAENLSPRRAEVHARIGDALQASGRHDEALDSYQRALDLGAGDRVLRRALEAAVRTRRVEPIVRLANEVLDAEPTDVRALVARGVALATEGQHEPARATFRTALRHGDDIEAHLALGRIELTEPGREAGARAAAEALAALRLDPGDPRARALLEEARLRELGRIEADGGDERERDAGELYRLASDLQLLLGARAELGTLAGEAAQAAADFDRPLLVTVMGEFSSGKSTFVNAFIGHDVAPTGITPTTATINVVKYGREHGGRIVYRDGVVETLSWEALFPALRALDAERARSIEVVEILLPLEQLERINLVDTPGLNSILPEHEEVARAFIARADAVVWLFTAGQAGKASERRALESIGREGTRVLGVLNKVDQLGDDETRQVIDYIGGELDGIVEAVVPLSARQALARQEGESDGNWAALAESLEERFFAQARQLKRQACTRRLASLLQRALAMVEPQRDGAREAGAALRGAADEERSGAESFIDEVVAPQRRELAARTVDLYRRAAREVLELVLPRRLPFGSHQATVADRDYLVALLDNGYESALERSRKQVVEHLRKRAAAAVSAAGEAATLLGADPADDVARTADDAVRLVEAQVYARTRAYLRGYLRGGYVDNFFRSALPKLELDEDSVYHALLRDSPDVDAEIAVPLASAGMEAVDALAQRLAHWAGVAEVLAFDVEVGILRALENIEERRRSIEP